MLTRSEILSLLEAHGVTCVVDGVTAYAEDVYLWRGMEFHEWVNVTNWTRNQIMNWLGY